MDSYVLNWLCATVVLLMPAVFSFIVTTATRGWVRTIILLTVFGLPLVALYRDHLCIESRTGTAETPCFAEHFLAWACLTLGLSAVLGAAAGAIHKLMTHAHADEAYFQ